MKHRLSCFYCPSFSEPVPRLAVLMRRALPFCRASTALPSLSRCVALRSCQGAPVPGGSGAARGDLERVTGVQEAVNKFRGSRGIFCDRKILRSHHASSTLRKPRRLRRFALMCAGRPAAGWPARGGDSGCTCTHPVWCACAPCAPPAGRPPPRHGAAGSSFDHTGTHCTVSVHESAGAGAAAWQCMQ